jgi:serine/threonine protein kinase/predicted alpha-1,6-mannanase (GH76 family)
MTDLIGQRCGNYRLLRFLGRGGFGNVYLGEHVYLNNQAAVKVLNTRLTDKKNLREFITEARTIQLKHPHIVQLLDFDIRDDDTPFLVMAYAPNGTLRQRHPKGSKLSLSTIVSYVKQVAEALQYAHDEKLIHRDVKPENMLLGPHNEIWLSDFGIATIVNTATVQKTESIAGTAVYMAPEQFKGKARFASDQYSLAVVVYEWLCGEPPFTTGDFLRAEEALLQLGYQHAYEPVPPLRQKVPSLSSDIEKVVMIALAKDPQQRFTSVQDFATALEQACRSSQQIINPDYRVYEEYATACVEALQGWYDKGEWAGLGMWDTTSWWNAANCLEAIIDYSRLLHTDKYHRDIAHTFERYRDVPVLNLIDGRRVHHWFDDENWWGLTWVKAYDLTKDARYLNAAKEIFAYLTSAWDDEVCDGGVWWNRSKDQKNSITNEEFFTLASRLYLRTGEPEYLAWANKAWRWFEASGLWDERHCLIYDHLDLATGEAITDDQKRSFTYTQGVILGGLVDWCRAVGGEQWAEERLWYLRLAENIATAAITHLITSDGLLTEKELIEKPKTEPDNDDRDASQFKGIFVRYLGYLIETLAETFDYPPLYRQYSDFILRNADAVWAKSRTSENLFGRLWGQAPGRTDASKQCSALDLFNAAIVASRLQERQEQEEPMKIYLHIEQVDQFFRKAQYLHDGELWVCKENSYIIKGALLDFYRTYGHADLCGLTYLGLPKTNEIDLKNGVVLQKFERGTVASDPFRRLDNPPGAGPIYLMHLDTPLTIHLEKLHSLQVGLGQEDFDRFVTDRLVQERLGQLLAAVKPSTIDEIADRIKEITWRIRVQTIVANDSPFADLIQSVLG